MKLVGNGGIRTISPKKHELWQFVEVDGKRKQKTRTFSGGKVEARAALRAFQNELVDIVPTSDTFAAYAASWLEWRVSCGQYSDSTIKNYTSAINQLKPYLQKPLADITPGDCKAAIASFKRDYAPSGTTLWFKDMVLRVCLETAAKDGLIASNPMRAVERPAKDTKERVALSPQELDKLWKDLEDLPLDGHTMGIFLAIDAGLRIGECVWLETKDVGETQLRVTRSKTTAGTGRVLPMTSRLAAKCMEWAKERERRGIADAVTWCCKLNGMPMTREPMRVWYIKHAVPLGAPAHFHDLRHSNLSKMARFMSAYDLQRWAGWSSIEMAKRYVHDDYTQLEQAVLRAECWENVGNGDNEKE